MSYSKQIYNLAKSTVERMAEYDEKIRKFEERKADFSPEYYRAELNKLKNEKNEIISANGRTASALYELQKDKIRAEFTLNPEQISEDAKLLQYGFGFTSSDIEKLLDKHKGNRTMERLISDYAQAHNIVHTRKVETESSKLAKAETMRSYYESVVKRPQFSDVWFDEGYFSELSEGVD